ncbi:DSS1/SEM1 family-domain-containing protein [Naematelia encephala]|uniref:26S proteasome complex subunit SEM1 n=1 Tax=Naematelia encephala TaxID=71784 RepID=A0A1Y2BCJ2_9TREE|nr:DSS1/SEM1 family-domain-containing protein [Naematelia encephala]
MTDQQPQSTEKKDEPVAGPSTVVKEEETKKKLPQLGALEDDDEFEEFEPNDDSISFAEAMAKNAANPGALKDTLWEDNWDDDDVEDDFVRTLRTAIQERQGGDEAMKD